MISIQTKNGAELRQDEKGRIQDLFLEGKAEGTFPQHRLGPDWGEDFFLAIESSQIVGFASLYVATGTLLWLDLLMVDRDWRRHHIGTKLLAMATATAERAGLALGFGIAVNNEPMKALAASFGLAAESLHYRKEPVG